MKLDTVQKLTISWSVFRHASSHVWRTGPKARMAIKAGWCTLWIIHLERSAAAVCRPSHDSIRHTRDSEMLKKHQQLAPRNTDSRWSANLYFWIRLRGTVGGFAKSDHPEPGNIFSTIIGVEAKIRTRHLPITRLARPRIYGTSAQTFNNVRIIYHQGAFMQLLLQWKINKFYIVWVYVSSLWYPACNAHAPLLYCHLWPVRLYNNFPHYLINGTIFGKKSYWV